MRGGRGGGQGNSVVATVVVGEGKGEMGLIVSLSSCLPWRGSLQFFVLLLVPIVPSPPHT